LPVAEIGSPVEVSGYYLIVPEEPDLKILRSIMESVAWAVGTTIKANGWDPRPGSQAAREIRRREAVRGSEQDTGARGSGATEEVQWSRTMPVEPYRGSVYIAAEPERVFDYFTKAEAIVRWMGGHAVLDPRPGGEFRLYISGVPVVGRYIEVEPPRRVVISWGREGSPSFPPGVSTLEVTLTPEADGTLVGIAHSGLPETEEAKHPIGWGHYLERLVIAGAGEDPGPDPWEASLPKAVMPDD
jgi:uncharacterized protein YndB with AHSA1/START domain